MLGRGTATFQILGETCTRACRYCYVHSGKPTAGRPARAAPARADGEADGAKHVVVTSVDRDDVPDSGAGHYAATIRALGEAARSVDRGADPGLPRRRGGRATDSARRAPDVFNHNIETVRRLHRAMRGGKASYDGALWLLSGRRSSPTTVLTKSGIIVGLGETNDEVVETLRDLRAHGVDVVTIGQYLQPSAKHATIDRWVHPDEFRWFREQGEALGFGSVFSGPLVRSSYRADEQRHAAATGRGAVAHQHEPCTGGPPTMGGPPRAAYFFDWPGTASCRARCRPLRAGRRSPSLCWSNRLRGRLHRRRSQRAGGQRDPPDAAAVRPDVQVAVRADREVHDGRRREA